LDAALGERRDGLVDERGGIGDAAPTARDAWNGEAEAHPDQKTVAPKVAQPVSAVASFAPRQFAAKSKRYPYRRLL
jgi:hypothetical protein